MKKILLLSFLFLAPVGLASVSAAGTECPGDSAIDCIISNFSDKKDVYGSIGDDRKVSIAFEGSNISFLIENAAQWRGSKCTTQSSNFFQVQTTLESIKNGKTPDFSYMECEEIEVEKPAEEVQNPLKVEGVQALDATNITLTFDQAIQHDTIWVRVVDPRDYSIIGVKSITKNTAKSANIQLEEALDADTQYNLRINTVLSQEQTTLAESDTTKIFTTPKNLSGVPQKEEETQTPPVEPAEVETPPAPAQEDANIEYTKEHPEGKAIEEEVAPTPVEEETEEVAEVAEAEALPQTGMDGIILMGVLAFCVAGLIAMRRKQV